jgi:hypothetical protein
MAVISIKNKTKSGSLLNGNPPFIPSDYESIATVTVGSGGASSITFSSIPSTYTHLQIRGIYRSNYAGLADNLAVRFNSDTGANYAEHIVRGDGSIVTVYGDPNMTFWIATFDQPAATAGANVFGVDVIDILDYANTNKYKTARNLSGRDNNGDGGVSLSSGLWQSTSAISTILLYPRYGTLMQQYSSFALYGIKG